MLLWVHLTFLNRILTQNVGHMPKIKNVRPEKFFIHAFFKHTQNILQIFPPILNNHQLKS